MFDSTREQIVVACIEDYGLTDTEAERFRISMHSHLIDPQIDLHDRFRVLCQVEAWQFMHSLNRYIDTSNFLRYRCVLERGRKMINEDAFCELMIQVFSREDHPLRKLKRFKSSSKWWAYTYVCVQRIAGKMRYTERRNMDRNLHYEMQRLQWAEGEEVKTTQLLGELDDVIARLDPEDCELLLKRFAGCSVTDIANEENKSTRLVYEQLRRIIESVRKMFFVDR